MSEKYRATIHGNRIEWEGDEPPELTATSRIKVDVTVVDTPASPNAPDHKRVVAALRKIAKRGGIKSIPDPVKWQREIRKDRPLPGR
jgi:hypothetical protein